MDVYGQIAELGRMQIAELRERYQEVFGEQTTTAHKQHLVRRIAWRLQVLAEGDLSERAHRRALKIADDQDLRVNLPARVTQSARTAAKRKPIQPDLRRPQPGSVLTRAFRGQTIEVKVLEDGFHYLRSTIRFAECGRAGRHRHTLEWPRFLWTWQVRNG
jgi:Protein of unknown function (DUF2924)